MKDLLFWGEFYMRGWQKKEEATRGFVLYDKQALYDHISVLVQSVNQRDGRIRQLERELLRYQMAETAPSSHVEQFALCLIEEILVSAFAKTKQTLLQVGFRCQFLDNSPAFTNYIFLVSFRLEHSRITSYRLCPYHFDRQNSNPRPRKSNLEINQRRKPNASTPAQRRLSRPGSHQIPLQIEALFG
jgi:hypothetical protein